MGEEECDKEQALPEESLVYDKEILPKGQDEEVDPSGTLSSSIFDMEEGSVSDPYFFFNTYDDFDDHDDMLSWLEVGEQV